MQISPAIPSAFSTIWRASRSELSSSALAAACANGPPEPIAIRPCSGSSTSPLPEIKRDASLSATASMASSRPSRRSVRHSLAISTAARVNWPLCLASLSSNSSNSVKASAVAPAKPASTSAFLPSRRILRALAFTTVLPSVTWPSPPRTTWPSLRTDRMVVAWKDSIAASWRRVMSPRWGRRRAMASNRVRGELTQQAAPARAWPMTLALHEFFRPAIVKLKLAVGWIAGGWCATRWSALHRCIRNGSACAFTLFGIHLEEPMNHKVKCLSLAVRVGLTAGLVAAAGLAQAQQAPSTPATNNPDQSQNQTKTLQTVVVTGSLIRRVDTETASPVTIIDRQNITNSGKPTLGDVLQQLPSIAGKATNPQNNSNGGGIASPLTEGGDGASRVSLRGLGTSRTLVLIDGQRMLNADMNLIPQNMIQRIDVLAEGASTVYGSDAVGGVVNILLRNDFNGAEISLNDGISSHGDGQRRGFSMTMGHSGDRYNIVGGLDYNKYDAVSSTRRDFSAHQLYLSSGLVSVAGSSSIPTGAVQVPPALVGQFNCKKSRGLPNGNLTLASGDGTSVSDYRCFVSGVDSYNYAAYNFIQVEQQRTDGFVLGSFNLTDNVTAFVDAFYNHTSSAGLDASIPIGTGDGLVIPATAPFNPFGVTFSQSNGGYAFQTRLTGVGTRYHPYTTSTGQLIAGLRGAVGQSSWNWNVSVNYGHTSRTQTDENEIYIP